MTLSELLEKAGATAAREAGRKLEKVDAVYDDELWVILGHYRLLEPLDAGLLRCAVTGVPLTRENVGGLIGTPQGPRPIADTYEAMAGLSARTEE